MSEIFSLCLKLAFGTLVSFFIAAVYFSFIYYYLDDCFEKYRWQICLFFIIYLAILNYCFVTANKIGIVIAPFLPLIINIIFDSIKSIFTKFFKKTNNNN